MLSKPSKTSGQSFIEVIITIAIIGILVAAIYYLLASSYELISFSKARITALELAQEKMEVLRNLPYNQLGTVNGIPSGILPQEETILRNNQNYIIKTAIIYIDDPFDKLAPEDSLPTDYKRIRIEVSWEGLAETQRNPIILLSDISPKSLETTVGGGTLSVQVFDSYAKPLLNANVQITANTSPPVNLNLKTGINGKILLPGAPACNTCYQITVSKPGFSQERTYSTTEVANPTKPHASIIQGSLTETSFAIDEVAILTFHTTNGRELAFTPFANVSFTLHGDKIIGTDTRDNPIYKYNQSLTTNALGELKLENMEWDNYYPIISNTLYNLSGTNPLIPIRLLPKDDKNSYLALSSASLNSLFLTFLDVAKNPIATVSATLKTEGFEKTLESGLPENPDYGQTYFNNLNNLTYTLTATASAYATYSAEIAVSGTKTEEIILNLE